VPLQSASFRLLTWFSSLERQGTWMFRVAALYAYLRLYRPGENERTASVQSRHQWQKECPVCSSP